MRREKPQIFLNKLLKFSAKKKKKKKKKKAKVTFTGTRIIIYSQHKYYYYNTIIKTSTNTYIIEIKSIVPFIKPPCSFTDKK